MAIDSGNLQNRAISSYSPKFGRSEAPVRHYAEKEIAALAGLPSHWGCDFYSVKSPSSRKPVPTQTSEARRSTPPNQSGPFQLRNARTGNSTFSNSSSMSSTTPSSRSSYKPAKKSSELSEAATPDMKTIVERETHKVEEKYKANAYSPLSDAEHDYYTQLLRARYYLSPTKRLTANLLSPIAKPNIKKVSAGRVQKSTKKNPSIISRIRAHRNSVPTHYQGKVRALEMTEQGGQLMHVDIPPSMPKITSEKPATSWRKVKHYLTPTAMQDIYPDAIATSPSRLDNAIERRAYY